MGISSALYSGISGLSTNGNAMSVIGNNIANTNTIGFKSSRTVFSDLLATTISGSGGTSQVGRGTQLSIVDNIFSQGTFENTESGTDLAIEGDSFFIVKAGGGQEDFYTRAGAFRFNADGYLVNPEGYRVQGKAFEANGTLSVGDPADIKVDIGTLIPARMTENIALTTNLDASAAVIAGGFNVNDPTGTSNYATSTRTFDSLGNTHLVTTYFTKTGANAWQWNTVTDASDLEANNTGRSDIVTAGETSRDGGAADADAIVTAMNNEITTNIQTDYDTANTGLTNAQAAYDADPSAANLLTLNTAKQTFYAEKYRLEAAQGSLAAAQTYAAANPADIQGTIDAAAAATDPSYAIIGNGNLTFDGAGNLLTGEEGQTYFGALQWQNASDMQQLSFDFNTTQYRSDSVVISQGQDGYGAGNLVKISIDGEGIVTANYSNGQRNKVSQIALAKFPNTGGLLKEGGNLFSASDTAGAPRIGTPSSELGKIFTNALEQSNVDLAQEFVKMITTQRGFQANSKIITTTDEMLGELINLKR